MSEQSVALGSVPAAPSIQTPSVDTTAVPDSAPILIRHALRADSAGIAGVALACGSSSLMSAAAADYLAHLFDVGHVVVAEGPGAAILGFAALKPRGAVAIVTDVFVIPARQGAGLGRRLVAALVGPEVASHPGGAIATFASADPRSLPMYAGIGARPRWPLMYLEVPGGGRRPLVPAARVDPGAALSLGADGSDLAVLCSLPDVRVVGVRAGLAGWAAVAAVRTDGSRVEVLRAWVSDSDAIAVLVAELAAGQGIETVALTVPGPHPSLEGLLAQGARVVDQDMFCSSDDAVDILDPLRDLPSPGLA